MEVLTVRDRLNQIRNELNALIIERDELIDLCLVSAIALLMNCSECFRLMGDLVRSP